MPERRQHIGNDKVIIYCCEERDVKFVPRFNRGEVNSVAIVCQRLPLGSQWNLTVFVRDRICGFERALMAMGAIEEDELLQMTAFGAVSSALVLFIHWFR